VSASAAQKKRQAADLKMMNNVTKRGLVPDPATDRRKNRLPTAPAIMIFISVVIVGSSVLAIINKAMTGTD